MKKIRYNKNIDYINKGKFNKCYMTRDIKEFKCCICRKDVSYKESFSNQGHKLICMHCFKKYFDNNFKDFDEWRNDK